MSSNLVLYDLVYDESRDVTGVLDLSIKCNFWPRSMLFRIFFSVSNPFETILRHYMRYIVKIVATS